MSSLVLIITGPIWGSSCVVEMDSGFVCAPCVVKLRKRGVYDYAYKNKKRYQPKGIDIERKSRHINGRNAKYVQVLKTVAVENPDIKFYVVAMGDSQHTTIVFSDWGSTEKWEG